MKRMFVLVFLIFNSNLETKASSINILQSYKNFLLYSEHWNFDCNLPRRHQQIKDADTLATLQKYEKGEKEFKQEFADKIQQTLFSGMSQLSKMNPEYFNPLLERAANKPLNIVCERLPLGSVAIYQPENLVKGLPSRMNLDLVAHYISSLGQVEHADLNKKYVLEQLILHEFLHFIEADNSPLTQHNFSQETGKKYSKSTDLIYSCVAQVFPTKSIIGVIERKGRRGWGNTKQACETCWRARFNDSGEGHLSESEEVLQQALQACAALREDDFEHELKAAVRNPYIEGRDFWLRDAME